MSADRNERAPRVSNTRRKGNHSPKAQRASQEAPLQGVDGSSDQEPALREEVRQALLSVLRSGDAPAGAKASAARTLMEFFDEVQPGGDRPADEMTEAELDAEIERLTRERTTSDE